MSMPEIKTHNINPVDAIADIIESIAMEEAALAHVINAEGEKIQFVLGTLGESSKLAVTKTEWCWPKISDLKEIDEIVNGVLKTVLKTQMLLQFKLEDSVKAFKELKVMK